MANTISRQTINDGERNLVVKVHIAGDGTGDESATALITMTDYNDIPDNVKVMRVQGELSGFSLTMAWDATTDVDCCRVPTGESDVDYIYIGGLINNSGAGKTGNIVFTTLGLDNGDAGTIVIEMRKRGA